MAGDSERKLHECDFPDCGKSFPKLWRLKEHQCSAHTGERPHVCTHPGCDKAFIRAYHLKRHLISHLKADEKPMFKCSHPGCDKSYTLKQNLRKHEKSHSNPLPYKCSTEGCGASFKKHSQLVVHEINQHGEEGKLFKCNHEGCGRYFTWPKELKRHQKIHTGYKCSIEGCEVTCSSWSEMRRHSSAHAKVCPECSRTFTRTRQLRLHAAVHAASRCVLTCQWEECGRTYTTLYNLQQHISSFHCKERPHSCTHQGCPATFSTKQACQRHMRTEHATQPKPKRKRKKKRSLASHLSGYDPSIIKDTSDSRMDTLPITSEGTRSIRENILDTPCGTNTGTFNSDVFIKSNDLDAVKSSHLNGVQQKNLKFLIPIVHRSRV